MQGFGISMALEFQHHSFDFGSREAKGSEIRVKKKYWGQDFIGSCRTIWGFIIQSG
jgi:hypothetical protein